jgi:hypothetical protein
MRSQSRQRAASQQEQGVYLDELDVDTLDPEVAALYFPHSYRGGQRSAPSDVPNKKPSRPSLTGTEIVAKCSPLHFTDIASSHDTTALFAYNFCFKQLIKLTTVNLLLSSYSIFWIYFYNNI